MREPRTLWLADADWSAAGLTVHYGIDHHEFSTTIRYEDVDLAEIARRYGAPFLRVLLFHITAFEANKLVSLRPDWVDPGPWVDLVTPAFVELWDRIVDGVWSQWRYENNLPDYPGPKFVAVSSTAVPGPVRHEIGSVPVLSFCGGGKDSLLAMRLLESAEIPYASWSYSHSAYGAAQPQHALVDALIDRCSPQRRHRQWVCDEAQGSPLEQLMPDYGVRSHTAAETPASLFAALPAAIVHGYELLALGHERSADTGNLVWDATGAEVNHQWGKSLEAEQLLQRYVREQLVETLSYASVLKPVHDLAIFAALGEHVDAVAATHSCNIAKPWCERCAKCAYVWLNYMAHLPVDALDGMFRTNLFDSPENLLWFRQMLGLEEHTPFECIGTIDEARWAFELCHRKGVTGAAMDMFRDEDLEPVPSATIDRLLSVDPMHHALPLRYATPLVAALERGVAVERRR